MALKTFCKMQEIEEDHSKDNLDAGTELSQTLLLTNSRMWEEKLNMGWSWPQLNYLN